jgi:hypothetical protein
LRAVQQAATALSEAARWTGSKTFVKSDDDYIYEFYVVMRLVSGVDRSTHRVTLRAGSPGRETAFPRKPANKTGWPYFEIRRVSDDQLTYQLCAGTRVSNQTGDSHAPDISLQAPGSPDDLPTGQDVLLIWDAKYMEDLNSRITRPQYGEFAMWVRRFGLCARGALADTTWMTINGIVANCIVTNGRDSGSSSAARQSECVVEITRFSPTTSHETHV